MLKSTKKELYSVWQVMELQKGVIFLSERKESKNPGEIPGKAFFFFQKEKKTKSAAKFLGEQIDAHFEASANTLYGRSQTKRN